MNWLLKFWTTGWSARSAESPLSAGGNPYCAETSAPIDAPSRNWPDRGLVIVGLIVGVLACVGRLHFCSYFLVISVQLRQFDHALHWTAELMVTILMVALGYMVWLERWRWALLLFAVISVWVIAT